MKYILAIVLLAALLMSADGFRFRLRDDDFTGNSTESYGDYDYGDYDYGDYDYGYLQTKLKGEMTQHDYCVDVCMANIAELPSNIGIMIATLGLGAGLGAIECSDRCRKNEKLYGIMP